MDVITVAKALSNKTRFRLLMALRGGELCVCRLVALVDLATATVSKHLLVLKNAGLVDARKDGRWMYYRIVEKPEPVVSKALKWAAESWDATPEAHADARALKKVCCQSPEELCQIQREKRA
jgi:DNA-binding transcriptional ArsR family regulator